MSAKREFQRLAKRFGILSPEVEYERRQKAYSIRIEIKNPGGVGYTNPAVGVYENLLLAEEQLEADIQAFLLRYPDAMDKVTERYHIVTRDEPPDIDNIEQLLQALQNKNHPYYIDDTVARIASRAVDYIAELESDQPPKKAKGTYSSRLPEQPKKPIGWSQPGARQHPVYVFEFRCPYCGDDVHLERHSPREPQRCDKVGCAEEHRRLLARERKRRQRSRNKKSQ